MVYFQFSGKTCIPVSTVSSSCLTLRIMLLCSSEALKFLARSEMQSDSCWQAWTHLWYSEVPGILSKKILNASHTASWHTSKTNTQTLPLECTTTVFFLKPVKDWKCISRSSSSHKQDFLNLLLLFLFTVTANMTFPMTFLRQRLIKKIIYFIQKKIEIHI